MNRDTSSGIVHARVLLVCVAELPSTLTHLLPIGLVIVLAWDCKCVMCDAEVPKSKMTN